jgi:hypothetical protein
MIKVLDKVAAERSASINSFSTKGQPHSIVGKALYEFKVLWSNSNSKKGKC